MPQKLVMSAFAILLAASAVSTAHAKDPWKERYKFEEKQAKERYKFERKQAHEWEKYRRKQAKNWEHYERSYPGYGW